jgi:HTH-type transcriptional repressor of NAD biosynthesis genes
MGREWRKNFGHLYALAHRHYDLVVLCDGDIAFVQDGTRQRADFRSRQQTWYEHELSRQGVPMVLVSGSVAQRIAQLKPLLHQILTTVSS